MIILTRGLIVATLATLLVVGLSNRGAAQVPCNTDSLKARPGEPLSNFTTRLLPAQAIPGLRDAVKTGNWSRAVEMVVANYQEELPDWLVYIDQNGGVSQCLIADNKADWIVRRKRFIWAMVFSEQPMPSLPNAAKPETAGGDTLDLRLWRRTVVQQADPVLVGLIKGFAKNFGLDSPAIPQPLDSVRPMDLRQISRDPKLDSFWVGAGRIGLTENSLIELSLSPWPTKVFPPESSPETAPQRIYANIANVRERTFELGIIGGVVKGKNVPSYDANLRRTSLGDKTDVGTFVSVFVNAPDSWRAVPWKAKWQRSSMGGFAGTNINGTFGDQFVAGFSWGHLISDAGISFGNAWVKTGTIKDGSLVSIWHRRLILGLDLRL